jgi:DNA invertase Pin-like site-specific DNA recombinase
VGRKSKDVGLTAEELAWRYRAGVTTDILAAATGAHRSTVQRRLKTAGIAMGPSGWPQGRRRHEAQDTDLVRRYRAGATIHDIAAATGLSRSGVHYRLKRAGVEMRPPSKAKGYGRLDLPVREIVERYRAGESAEDIGRSLGIAGQTVRVRLAEAGIERRKTRRGSLGKPKAKGEY